MTENPIDTKRRRSIMQPDNKQSKAKRMATLWGDLAEAEEEIDVWTKAKIEAEKAIEKEHAHTTTKSVHEGSGSEKGCEGTVKESGS